MYKINFTVGDECLTHIGLYTLVINYFAVQLIDGLVC